MYKKVLNSAALLLCVALVCILQISPSLGDEVMEIPILMYHHFADDVQNDMIVSKDTFEMHMRALSESGYTTVTFDELIAYVEDGRPLPEKPICITMDDGYLSNREIAFPILQKPSVCL